MKPDICTSQGCYETLRDIFKHCTDCYHAFYKGEGKDKSGKLWRWEYRPSFGVYFVRRSDGKHLKYQPIVGDPVFELFEKWKKEKGL